MRGIVIGVALAAFVLSCMSAQHRPPPEWQVQMDKMNEVTQLWSQIREWRGAMDMPLDPAASTMLEFRGKTVREARRVCTDNHRRPVGCQDSCTLSDHICENADLICQIADELGKNDRAQEKCTSAKASCREGKQRCCNKCSTAPAAPAKPTLTPASTKTTTTPVPPKSSSISSRPQKVAR